MSFHPHAEPARRLRATTILGVRRDGAVALAGDGQVTQGDVVLKHGARKIRTLYDGQVLAGFAGAVADALTLFAKFEVQLKAWDGNLRRLEADPIVADPASILVIHGDGDVIEPDDGIVAIGSGAPYATAAAKALLAHTDFEAREIVESAMAIAADLCIFTNDRFSIESVRRDADEEVATEGDLAAADRELPIDGPLQPADTGGDDDEEDEDEAAARSEPVDDDEEEDG